MGAKEVSGSLGQTLTDRTLFTDVTRSFASLRVGAVLTITSGANEGTYTVTDMLFFPVGADSTARAYTTSPTGLSGTATVSADGIITDSTQDFGACEEGETLTFTAGSNVGAYRLDVLLGSNGGPVGAATGPATEVRAAPCVLRVNRRMPQVLSGQSYTVTVDRLGRQETRTVTDEDVANQFYI